MILYEQYLKTNKFYLNFTNIYEKVLCNVLQICFFALFSKVCARYTVVCHRFSILNRNNYYLHRNYLDREIINVTSLEKNDKCNGNYRLLY